MLHVKNANIGYSKSLFTLENLDVSKGEILCILGNNGCGKSTLLQNMAGFLPLLSGTLTLKENCRTAFLGSRSVSHPQLKVIQALLLAFNRDKAWYASYTSAQENECIALLHEFEMADVQNAYINELSDGQMQKLWLGQALLSKPDILFLDEPTGHLDANNTAFIFQRLRSWADTHNKTVVLVSHKIDWVLQISDRFLLIEDGKSSIFNKNSSALTPTLNRCFSGNYHTVDFSKTQYALKFANKN